MINFSRRNKLWLYTVVCTLLFVLLMVWQFGTHSRMNSDEPGSTQPQKLAEYKQKPLLPITASAKLPSLTGCQQVAFTKNELSEMCSATVSQPACMVEHIDHLEQKAFVQATLRLSDGQQKKIFVNPPTDGMSAYIIKSGFWERSSVYMVIRALKAIPGSALIDVGCNLGVYTLAASIMGYRVVAVDASYQVVMRVRKSLEANGLTNGTDVFWNALSEKSGKVALRYPNCDFSLLITQKGVKSHFGSDPVEVNAIKLDDIVVHSNRLKGVKDLIIKIDIEGSEWNVFATAYETFKRFNVAMVLMEWEWTAALFPEKTIFITEFMVYRGFSPYAFKDGKVTTPLSTDKRLKWPPDVLWLHNKTGLKDKL